MLPLEQTVVEIPETVQPGDCVIAACNRLKPSGYLIALDDFIPQRCAAPSLRFRQNHQDRFSDHCDRRKSRSHPPFRIGQATNVGGEAETQRVCREELDARAGTADQAGTSALLVPVAIPEFAAVRIFAGNEVDPPRYGHSWRAGIAALDPPGRHGRRRRRQNQRDTDRHGTRPFL